MWFAAAWSGVCALGIVVRGIYSLPLLDGPELGLILSGSAATFGAFFLNVVLPVDLHLRRFLLGLAWPLVFLACAKASFWVKSGAFPGYGENELPIVALICVVAGCTAQWGFGSNARS